WSGKIGFVFSYHFCFALTPQKYNEKTLENQAVKRTTDIRSNGAELTMKINGLRRTGLRKFEVIIYFLTHIDCQSLVSRRADLD
ncbi:MAG: hypothetical protein MJZ91_11615, partial [Bacteroidales bacterium]|nr:hypothetical protein [Bacteroidales bacterium]